MHLKCIWTVFIESNLWGWITTEINRNRPGLNEMQPAALIARELRESSKQNDEAE